MKIKEIVKNLIGKRQRLLIFCASAALLLIVAMVAISSATSLANGSESGRTDFFLVTSDELYSLNQETLENYGNAETLMQSYVFKGTDEVVVADIGNTLSYTSYFHDFELRPYNQETLIGICTYYSGVEHVKLEIKYSGSEDGGLMFLSENYDVTPVNKKLQGTVINTDEHGTTTALIDIDSSLLNELSYLTFSSCSEYILKLTSYDPNLVIYSISIYSYDGTFAIARGMSGYTEYIEPFAQISYTQGTDQIIGCRYSVFGNGVSVCSNAAGSICIDECADGYYVDIYGGLSEEAIQKELKNVKSEEESTEETTSEETTDESTDESTEKTSSEETTDQETTGESTEETSSEITEESNNEITEATQVEEPASQIDTQVEEIIEPEVATSEPETTGTEETENTISEPEAA